MPYLTAILSLLVVLLALVSMLQAQGRRALVRHYRSYFDVLKNDRDEARARLYELNRVVAQTGELLDHAGVAFENHKQLERESRDLKALGAILRTLRPENHFSASDPETLLRKVSALGKRYGIEPHHRFDANGMHKHDYDAVQMIRIGEEMIEHGIKRALALISAHEVSLSLGRTIDSVERTKPITSAAS